MLRFIVLNSIIFVISGSALGAPKCSDVFKTYKWRNSVSEVFFDFDSEKTIHIVYNRPTSRILEEWYPGSYSTAEILKQDALQLELVGKLLWRLQSPLSVVKVRVVENDNKYSVKEQEFDPSNRTWFQTTRKASSLVLNDVSGVRLIDVIHWLNGERSSPANWLVRENAIERVATFNASLIEFQNRLERFAKGKIEQSEMDLETNSQINYNTLDLTLVNQRSSLDGGRAFLTISPSNTLLTPEGKLVIVAPF